MCEPLIRPLVYVDTVLLYNFNLLDWHVSGVHLHLLLGLLHKVDLLRL